jgi:PBSX family phage terminase large subunit
VSALVAEQSADILLFPRQMRFVKDPARFPAYVGGIGSGKTFAGACKVIARLGRKELGLVAAPTYSMLRDATQRTLLALLDDLGIGYDFRKGENALTVLATGHEIIFRSLDNPENLRGPNLDYAWVDEGSLLDRMAWLVVKGRVRVGFNPQAWLTCTPKGRNYVWEEWERDANPDHPLYRVRTEENPELPTGYAQSLGYVGVFADQELGGEFVAHEGLVYPSFQRKTHVRVIDTEDWRRVLGVDVGTRNPTAILDARIAGDGRIHIAGEVYRRNMGTADVLAAIRATAAPRGIEVLYIDPSAADYRMDLEAEGYPVMKADNAVLTGIGRVTTALAEGLTIDPSCVNLIAEFESYSYPEGGRVDKDAPIKQNDHALDALRYIVAGEAEPQPQYWIA